jgi:hypothetical protein
MLQGPSLPLGGGPVRGVGTGVYLLGSTCHAAGWAWRPNASIIVADDAAPVGVGEHDHLVIA